MKHIGIDPGKTTGLAVVERRVDGTIEAVCVGVYDDPDALGREVSTMLAQWYCTLTVERFIQAPRSRIDGTAPLLVEGMMRGIAIAHNGEHSVLKYAVPQSRMPHLRQADNLVPAGGDGRRHIVDACAHAIARCEATAWRRG